MDLQWLPLAALVLVTVLLGVVWRRRQGRVRTLPTGTDVLDGPWPQRVADLGAELGARATFVQFSAEVCAPCRATARTLRAVADVEDGIVHVEVDVDAEPGLVAAADVRRTPTVLVLDDRGNQVARASGAMTLAQVHSALAAVTQTRPTPRSST